jgi:hypothetical protein
MKVRERLSVWLHDSGAGVACDAVPGKQGGNIVALLLGNLQGQEDVCMLDRHLINI